MDNIKELTLKRSTRRKPVSSSSMATGPMSRYGKSFAYNNIGHGERIIPLTEEEARKWCEKYCDGGTYEAVFGDAAE